MQVQSIINSIKRGVISPVYLLYGSEEYLQEKVIDALKETLVSKEIGSFNLAELEGEEITIGELVDLANTLPVFAEKRLVIVQDFPFLQSGKKKAKTEEEDGEIKNLSQSESAHKVNEEKRLLEYLTDPLSSTCLVFWQKGAVNRGRKIYKAIVKNGYQVLELNSLRGRNLNSWLLAEAEKMGKSLEPQAVDYLVFNCGEQLRDLHNELEKLSLYSGEEKTITLAMVQKLVAKSSEGNIFSLVDSLGEKKEEQALVELRNLLTIGEIPTRIIYMITRQFRLILLVKDLGQKGYTEKEITAKLKLHPYITGKIRRQAANFSFLELEKSLELIRKYDLGLKSGFKPQITLENLIIALAS
ncbi:MAG TPA: DNA polymerase III subunit delta [Clostridia bacterium]|jgi:DNA polymerase-3 subunit delta|nr:DNA polymerase III subunit delta [Clostridia bacterium]HHY06361.1 DNA polymerase III subunit delta [Clostridia bacterium]